MNILFCTTEYEILQIKPHSRTIRTCHFKSFKFWTSKLLLTIIGLSKLLLTIILLKLRMQKLFRFSLVLLGSTTFFYNYPYGNNNQNTLKCNQYLNNKSREFRSDIIISVRNFMVRFMVKAITVTQIVLTPLAPSSHSFWLHSQIIYSDLILYVNRAPSILQCLMYRGGLTMFARKVMLRTRHACHIQNKRD